ncbi:hypothetical protein HYQ45_018358 [Verticillium longisporum]|uniref:Uncharacterized protein n=1 Tax=Verticillium longisporum TaxID=100787 RepID=A0A8I2Z2Q4_VERLO|nr:hypothetical protein HYQ45_018358 [Verticillium longisporum]
MWRPVRAAGSCFKGTSSISFITVNTITVNTITSNTITSNTITSNTITVSTITVSTITVSTIPTFTPSSYGADLAYAQVCTLRRWRRSPSSIDAL